MGLSVGIITFNEEKKIEKTLKAIKSIADEIIIVDSYSIDKTVEIAKKYNAKVFIEKWKGFGKQKNSVIEKCNNEWILIIDADEVVSEELANKIKTIIFNKNNEYDVYKINRCSICFGKEIKYGGWSNDYVVRLFKKGKAKLDDAIIHESFLTEEKIGKIKEKLYHYTYLSLEEYFNKFNSYTTKGAIKRKEKGKKASISTIIFNPFFKFFKMYILKLGFLDGFYGFILAMLAYIYNFVIQVKLYMLKDDK
ncbi:glycosyltransferase involved in cell wall biosynthesis [Hypnocyclicus thermotrophus]|uniref:Glycosyltransferase involved in cell wall biosynthesis n=1 Tax=Hypnocyclicus thermotrophus TaxID=1627895 RepID=A0AA46DYW1_9FUSO|nr:glycosyltransferase family 2 protein [Hypnocyclicus thermotrophus]TDT70617.1 glycosyltransferase involved in cell wall biosynthesis [Hypnocyclicus thermotrophus]